MPDFGLGAQVDPFELLSFNVSVTLLVSGLVQTLH